MNPFAAAPACLNLDVSAEDARRFVADQRGRWVGRARGIAQPRDTAEVAELVAWCSAQRIPIVPQGGNTGLVHGSVPDESGQAVLLSLARMNRVRAIDTVNNTITVEAGCVLADVQAAAREAGRLFPLSLAAEGSCTIGGNLSTNAGGVQVLRYGNARELCLGLEVVTADGDVWNGLRGLRKDNTGYDLRDLFIGAEGTLGVITAATMKLYPRPAAQLTAFAALADPHAALRLLELAQARLASSLTAFELVSEFCIELVMKNIPGMQRPLADAAPYYALLESSDPQGAEQASGRFQALMEEAFEQGLIADAAVAASIAQSRAFWALRENVSAAQAREGQNIKHDISVPISSIGRFIDDTNRQLAMQFPGIRMVVFGHLGDGNLHYNVSPPPDMDGDAFMRLEEPMNRVVYDAVARHHGSISAEHGIGGLKLFENERYKSAIEMSLMRRIKRALDPLNLMNPGRVIRIDG